MMSYYPAIAMTSGGTILLPQGCSVGICSVSRINACVIHCTGVARSSLRGGINGQVGNSPRRRLWCLPRFPVSDDTMYIAIDGASAFRVAYHGLSEWSSTASI